jgi:hypothetical protein
VARLWLGEAQGTGSLVQLETNIDDMNPQLYPAVSEKLFAAGAKDVWLTPIQMKKGRPGVLLAVLGPAELESALAETILRHTTTLGVRVHSLGHRHEAVRQMREVETPFGRVAVKVKWVGQEAVGATPEFEDCRALADAAGVPLRAVLDSATAAAQILLMQMRQRGNLDADIE